MRFAILNGTQIETVFDMDESKAEEYAKHLPDGLSLIDPPDYVEAWWTKDETGYHAPEQEGWQYDYVDKRYYSHTEYRKILHERTSNDTLQALRKIREGDTTYDWQAWLNKLDAYNVAIEDTKNQETYPQKVVYPEYPTR